MPSTTTTTITSPLAMASLLSSAAATRVDGGVSQFATPLKEDSTHSKSSSYSPLSQCSPPAPEYHHPRHSPSVCLSSTAGGGGGNAPILSPSSSQNNSMAINSGELWSVARLTALERNAVVAAAVAEQSIHSHHPHHHQHPHPHSHSQQQHHLNGYYAGENLIINKASSGSSAAPVSVSPPIYGHQSIHGGSSSSASSAVQKPIATFYRHELAKQFHLYRSHHSHLHQQQLGEATAPTPTTPPSQPNGVV